MENSNIKKEIEGIKEEFDLSYSQDESVNKIKLIRDYFNQCLNLILSNENQFFPNNYSKIIFLKNKFNLSDTQIANLKQVQKIFALTRFNKYNANENDERFIINQIEQLVDKLIYFKINESVDTYSNKNNQLLENYFDFKKARVDLNHSVLIAKKTNFTGTKENFWIRVSFDDNYEANILLQKHWKMIYDDLKMGLNLNLLNLQAIDLDNNLYYADNESYIIIEPNYFFDITELAECFNQQYNRRELYFIKRFEEQHNSEALFKGNLYNYLFDELLLLNEKNNNINIEKLKNEIINQNLLTSILISINYPLFFEDIDGMIAQGIIKVKKALKILPDGIISIEPSFVSNKYGLSGRLDLLIESPTDDTRKDIIELKSGSSPKTLVHYKNLNNIRTQVSAWVNHFFQITYYNLLLDSNFSNRIGNSSILYINDDDNMLRNCLNETIYKAEAINFRNKIIIEELKILHNEFSIFRDLKKIKSEGFPKYSVAFVEEFKSFLNNSDELSKKYFIHLYKFISREVFASKTGIFTDNSGNKLYEILEKLNANEIAEQKYLNLNINKDKCDFEKWHLVFNYSEINSGLAEEMYSLRKGDIVLIFPRDGQSEGIKIQNQILKGVIKEINEDLIKVSLRNKQTNIKIIEENSDWCIIPDNIDFISKKLYKNLFYFINSARKKIILGIEEPRFKKKKYTLPNYLNSQQSEAVNRALNTEDYLLIQGPPGTGKTSYVLKSIVENLYKNTNEDILILAYTNRAVDEICSKLIESGINNFLRLGNKGSSEHKEYLISEMQDGFDFDTMKSKIINTRIFIGTIISGITSNEIFEIKKFETCIIDEASQILEPYLLGILSKVSKFIMIGDEKQLPAISLSKKSFGMINDIQMNEIGMTDISKSLFERLIANAKKNNWSKSYILLKEQSRMHEQIMNLSNNLFYKGELEINPRRPERKIKVPKSIKIDNEGNKWLVKFNKRVIYLENKPDKSTKTNLEEAKLVAKIVEELVKYQDDINIGIISNFKSQCSLIKSQLTHIKSNIDIDTVERFQGSERDVIIYSTCINKKSMLSKISSEVMIDGDLIDRKLNVSITRAKEYLIIIGNKELLESKESYKKLIEMIGS